MIWTADAWNALNLRTRYYTTRLHIGAFYLPAFLEEMLREVEEKFYDLYPNIETFIGCESSFEGSHSFCTVRRLIPPPAFVRAQVRSGSHAS